MRVPKLTRWWGALALLVTVRLAIPLAAYAAGSSRLPGIPRFTRSARDGGLTGDATGFYDATRDFMAAWGRMAQTVGISQGFQKPGSWSHLLRSSLNIR